MTTPSVLQRLYPRGPFVDEVLKQRLSLHRERFWLVLTISLTSVVHVIVFLTVAWLLRHFDVDTRLADLALAVVAALIFTSMGSSIVPALIEHWHSESGVATPAGKRRLRVEKLPQIPPLNAEFLFYLFLRAEDCDAVLGDLEERYEFIRNKFGARRANFWFWTQTVSLTWIVWEATKKALKSMLGVAALVEMYRKMTS